MTSQNPDTSCDAELIEARRLLGQGRLEDSVRAYQGVLEKRPGQIEALNAIGMWTLRAGNLQQAVRYLEEGLRAEPGNALTLHNLAQAYQASGDGEQARKTYARALKAEPGLYVARIALARLYEESGDAARALPLYFRAVTDAQREGRWISRDSTAPALQPLVQHAMRQINSGRRRLYEQLLEPLRQRFGRDEMRRVDGCLDTYLGDRKPEVPDPRQQPTFLRFPGLPASPFLERSLVPGLRDLEEMTGVIQAELRAILEGTGSSAQEAVFSDPALARANLAGHRGAPSWNGYYFYRHGVRRGDNCAACPRTIAALDALPLCRVRDHGPEVLFSVLSPGTHLLPHNGVTNTRIVGHLALTIPGDCALRVAGEEYRWVEGRAVLFDDTYPHEAWNRSEHQRVVLIFDLWNPHLRPAERVAVTALIEAIGDFRAAAEIPAETT
jgi:aspartate beta-hydroxylase